MPARRLTNGFWSQCRKRWQLFLFFLVPLIYLAIFNYYPMLGVQIAFKQYTAGMGIWGSPWVGLKHFKTFFTSYQFTRTMTNTVILSFYSLVVSFPLAIVFALSLNAIKNLRFKKLVQTVTYMPHFISVVVLVGILYQVLNPVNGLYGNLSRLFELDIYPTDIIGKAATFRHLYVWSGVWQGLGWSSIIYFAALSSVDLELHEAAMIDGASRFARIIHIDLPAIIPTASIMLILSAGSIMNVGFEKTFLMQNDMNLVKSEIISTYIYKVGLNMGSNFSFGSAIGLFNSLINCLLLVIVNALSRRMNEEGTSLW